jgi:DHA2 family multidrug resistance protein
MLDRGAQFHQNHLAANLYPGNPMLQERLQGVTAALKSAGSSQPMEQAYALLQSNVQRQASMLSYIDNFRILAIVSLCLIPLVFLIKKPRKGGEMAVH